MTFLLQDMLLFSFNSLDSLKMGTVGIEDFKINMKGKAGKLDEDQSRKLVSVRVCE
jgi:urease alpha subunit